MTKTAVIKELRRVVRRLAAYPVLNVCVSDTCRYKTRSKDKCIFCDAAEILKNTR